MSNASPLKEPSMEEILASIRRIIESGDERPSLPGLSQRPREQRAGEGGQPFPGAGAARAEAFVRLRPEGAQRPADADRSGAAGPSAIAPADDGEPAREETSLSGALPQLRGRGTDTGPGLESAAPGMPPPRGTERRSGDEETGKAEFAPTPRSGMPFDAAPASPAPALPCPAASAAGPAAGARPSLALAGLPRTGATPAAWDETGERNRQGGRAADAGGAVPETAPGEAEALPDTWNEADPDESAGADQHDFTLEFDEESFSLALGEEVGLPPVTASERHRAPSSGPEASASAVAGPERGSDPVRLSSMSGVGASALNSAANARSSMIAEASSLMSREAGAEVAAAFDDLARAIRDGQMQSMEEMAREMLRPMLQDWLDDNLPRLVERLVREEIERVARGGRR